MNTTIASGRRSRDRSAAGADRRQNPEDRTVRPDEQLGQLVQMQRGERREQTPRTPSLHRLDAELTLRGGPGARREQGDIPLATQA